MGVWQFTTAGLALIVLILLARLLGMKQALRQIAKALHEKLHTDTNTPITTQSSDRTLRRFLAALNRELRTLRQERLRLEGGSHELQSAVTNIAHDLRTPLTAISGYLELLEAQQPDEPSAAYLAVIRERTNTLTDLTEELFRYSVIDTTADTLKSETVCLNRELEIALAAIYQTLTEKNIVPQITIPPQAVMRQLDAKALQRIFGNILTNAARYSAGDLSVVLDPKGAVTFSNTAPSLSEIEVGKLFDRFYTVENAKGSTGLGLSIAKLLTEKMGGSISASYDSNILSITVTF